MLGPTPDFGGHSLYQVNFPSGLRCHRHGHETRLYGRRGEASFVPFRRLGLGTCSDCAVLMGIGWPSMGDAQDNRRFDPRGL